ncbi:hypothetical protein ECG_07018 [Echinococcus granulosus]|uniref:Uncharacterized protein n=1 Tax=Echinococcus granulosus TaxID=6210 RepID=A0A068WZA4_ECHGR|nr:hypothetical protein ECG_07018 [Echinococcus granulosus]CDS23021.1 hypothetical protein EgrG_002034300 [Echinococcus granulosus]
MKGSVSPSPVQSTSAAAALSPFTDSYPVMTGTCKAHDARETGVVESEERQRESGVAGGSWKWLKLQICLSLSSLSGPGDRGQCSSPRSSREEKAVRILANSARADAQAIRVFSSGWMADTFSLSVNAMQLNLFNAQPTQ